MADVVDIGALITRQDAIVQSGLTSGQLSRLDKSGMVVPQKYGSKEHPAVLYTLEQVKELQLVATFKNRLTSAEIKHVLCVTRQRSWDDFHLEEWLVLLNEGVYFFRSIASLGYFINQVVQRREVATLKIVSLLKKQPCQNLLDTEKGIAAQKVVR